MKTLAPRGSVGGKKPTGDTLIVYHWGAKGSAMLDVLGSHKKAVHVIHLIDTDKFKPTGFFNDLDSVKESVHAVLMIDHEFDAPTIDLVAKGVNRNLPVVIGSSRELPKKVWNLKSDAQARGGIFEVANRHKDYRPRINSTLRAIRHWYIWRNKSRETLDHFPTWVHDTRATKGEEAKPIEAVSLPGVSQATRLLRAASGRLDAEKIRELFGLKRAEMAALIGVTAEALRQTPDSKNIQDKLSHFEKIGALLTLVKEPETFRKWLHAPNPELNGLLPLNLINNQRWNVVENLVADILENRGR